MSGQAESDWREAEGERCSWRFLFRHKSLGHVNYRERSAIKGNDRGPVNTRLPRRAGGKESGAEPGPCAPSMVYAADGYDMAAIMDSVRERGM